MLKESVAEVALRYEKNPNPQGKGVVPVLRDWATMQRCAPAAKAPAVFLRDYCMSSLVLAARFRFKPVPGKAYFLYVMDNDWMLSLIAPHEWGERGPEAFLGECRLRPDMTWEIDTSECGEGDVAALAKAQKFIEGFVETLAAQDAIVEHLPFYVAGLPYYQRLLATALAASLQRSLPGSGEQMQSLLGSTKEWLLPSLEVPLE